MDVPPPAAPTPALSKEQVVSKMLIDLEKKLDKLPKKAWSAKSCKDTFSEPPQKLIFGRVPNSVGGAKIMINGTNNTRLSSTDKKDSEDLKTIHEALIDVMNYVDMDFEYSTIQVNKDSVTNIHTDKQNNGVSYGCSLGNFKYKGDGDLMLYPEYQSSRKTGDPEYLDYRYQLKKFDAHTYHTTNPTVKGKRYAILFFRHTYADDTDCHLDLDYLRQSDYINKFMADYRKYEQGKAVKYEKNIARYEEIKQLRDQRDEHIAPCYKLGSIKNADNVESFVGDKMFWRYCDEPEAKQRVAKGNIKDWHWDNRHFTSLTSAKLLARFVETHDYASYSDFLRKIVDKKTWKSGSCEPMPNLSLTSERIRFDKKKMICKGPKLVSNKKVCEFAEYLESLTEEEATDAVNYFRTKLRTRKYNWLLYYVKLMEQKDSDKHLDKRKDDLESQMNKLSLSTYKPVELLDWSKGFVPKKEKKKKEIDKKSLYEGVSKDDTVYVDKVLDCVVKNSTTTFDNIKGLDDLIKDMSTKIKLRLYQPHLLGNENEAIGFLMYGPPGCGKTMIATALTNSIDMDATFFNIQSSNVTSKYLGEAEKFVEFLFKVARKQTYSVIFMDECENVFKDRAMRKEDDGTASILTQFMTEWNSPENGNIVIIGATNRPDMIDGAIGRRFKTGHFYIPLPNADARRSLINYLLGKNGGQRHELSYENISTFIEKTIGYNCSDISAIMNELNALIFNEQDFTDEELKGSRIEKSSFRPIVLDDVETVLKKYKSKVKASDVLICEEFGGHRKEPQEPEQVQEYDDEGQVSDHDDEEDEAIQILNDDRIRLQEENRKLKEEMKALKSKEKEYIKVLEKAKMVVEKEKIKALKSKKKLVIKKKKIYIQNWKSIKVYVISLKENNEERRTYMNENMKKAGFTNWEYVDAITGVDMYEQMQRDKTWRYETQSDSEKKMLRKAACLCSHVATLKRALSKPKFTPFFIFEDDISFQHRLSFLDSTNGIYSKDDIAYEKDDALYQFGWTTDSDMKKSYKDEPVLNNCWKKYVDGKWVWCTRMYFVKTKMVAETLLANFEVYVPFNRTPEMDKMVDKKIKNWTSDCILTKVIMPKIDTYLLEQPIYARNFKSAIDLDDIRIAYMGKSGQLGGWRSFCVHLNRVYGHHDYDKIPYVYQITTTGKGGGDFHYGIKYKTCKIETLANIKNVIVGCVSKENKDLIKQLNPNHYVVVHDPNELTYLDIEDLKKVKVITIRKSVHDLLKTKGVDSQFILHPFVGFNFQTVGKTKIISTARCSARKQTNMLLDANKIYANDMNGEIGCELHCDVDPFFNRGTVHPMFEKSYKGKFEATFDAMANVYKDAIATVDLSIFQDKGEIVDGGGTQYTFLEAIYSGTIIILHMSWLSFPSVFQANVNCFAVRDAKDLANLMMDIKDPNRRMRELLEKIPKNAKKILESHTGKEWLKLF
jgi:SpoVK/Ycf46/Vps4 family AAA+-type ATPase/GR25 family glycosyltransferase involved in LPS biosynthesis